MKTFSLQKKEIREHLLRSREEKSEAEVERCSKAVLVKLKSILDERQSSEHPVKNVFIYYPMRNELSFFKGFMEYSRKQGINIALPRTKKEKSMDFCTINDESELEPGIYGELVPSLSAPIEQPDGDTLLIIPALGCSSLGYRIGYGGGYYDRYLNRYKDVLRASQLVCVCYNDAIFSDQVNERWDIAVGTIVTESRILRIINE